MTTLESMDSSALPEHMRSTVTVPTEVREQLTNLTCTGPGLSEEFEEQHATELLSRIAWSRLAEPGDQVAVQLVSSVGATRALAYLVAGASAKRIVSTSEVPDVLERLDVRSIAAGLKRWKPRLDQAETFRDIERAVEYGASALVPSHPLWPDALSDLEMYQPLMLWTKGNVTLFQTSSVAIVGARASSAYGEHATAEFAEEAVHLAFNVVSGAAYGIDAVAHRATLAAGGHTVAVLAGGVDRPYPAGHTQLLGRVAQDGLVCSELIPGAPPTRWRFLQRNRLIASLSTATLVTEAGVRSGSLNTAGHAAQLGRALGAVPGPVTSPSSTGCHKLIREYDATLVSSRADLRELLMGGDVPHQVYDGVSAREPAFHQRVFDTIPLRGARTLADISRGCGLSLEETSHVLTELELLGTVSCAVRSSLAESKWKIAK